VTIVCRVFEWNKQDVVKLWKIEIWLNSVLSLWCMSSTELKIFEDMHQSDNEELRLQMNLDYCDFKVVLIVL
jgi:hypothetical protein